MKIAVITGASSGMGREFAIQLSHEANFDEMWVIARRKEALESLKDQVCCPIRPIAMDLLNPDSFQQICWIWCSRKSRFWSTAPASGNLDGTTRFLCRTA